jgi:hypothetical protein
MVTKDELVDEIEIKSSKQIIFDYLKVPLQLEKLNENM